MIYYHTQPHSGFSMVEMLVAISILLLVIIGPMTVSTRAAKSSSFATEQVQAFFHAQEGLEMVQKLRDDAQLLEFQSGVPASPFSGIIDTCITNAANGCGLSWNIDNPPIITSVDTCGGPTSAACRLHLRDVLTGTQRSKFVHSTTDTTPTPFTRRIKITLNGSQIKVSSEVTWRTGALIAEQKVVAVTYLYDIYN